MLVVIGGAALLIHYLDLKRRVYSVYDGLLEYHEGFLTQNDAFIPMENLSNSEVTRGIVERLTNLYQVKVSCQGAGQEILFRHLEHGAELDRVIGELIDRQSVPSSPATDTVTAESAPREGRSKHSRQPAAERDTETTASFKMHGLRTMTPYLLSLILLPVLVILFPLLIILAIFVVRDLIKMKNTTYNLMRNSVKEEFALFVSKTREFTTDKITGVTFRESFIDKWFGTCSIEFWSIGAGEEITFCNIPKDEGLQGLVLGKAGIRTQNAVYSIDSQFSAPRMLLANIPAILLMVVSVAVFFGLAIALHGLFATLPLAVVVFVILAYLYRRYYYMRSSITLYGDCLEFVRGLVIRKRTCALYPNVKDISTIKYPGLNNGSMRVNVAGEKILQTKNGEVRIPYGFTVHYVPDILNKDDVFDSLLLGSESALEPAAPVMSARKAAGNTVFVVVLVSLILVIPVVLLPITVAIAIWRARLVRYIIEPDRVLMRKGVLYRKQTSIIYDRIDHIQTGQGPLNKFFKNGNITINTAGSSKPELVLRDLPSWQDFHRELRRHY